LFVVPLDWSGGLSGLSVLSVYSNYPRYSTLSEQPRSRHWGRGCEMWMKMSNYWSISYHYTIISTKHRKLFSKASLTSYILFCQCIRQVLHIV
jgi:hypothetical protein